MKTCALFRQIYLKQSPLSQINEITSFNPLLRPNYQIFECQSDLVGDLAFHLCAGVGPDPSGRGSVLLDWLPPHCYRI